MESPTCLLNHNQRSDKLGSTLTKTATAFMVYLSFSETQHLHKICFYANRLAMKQLIYLLAD